MKSKKIHFGPYSDYKVNPYFQTDYIYTMQTDTITFDDSKWNIPGLDSARTHSFLTVQPDIEAAFWGDSIATYRFRPINKSVQYERQVKSYLQALSEAGGLFDILLLIFLLAYEVLFRPLDQLEILQEFYQLYRKIDVEDGEIMNENMLDSGQLKTRYWLLQRLPCLSYCCKKQMRRESQENLTRVNAEIEEAIVNGANQERMRLELLRLSLLEDKLGDMLTVSNLLIQ